MADKPKPVNRHIVLNMPVKRRLPKKPAARIDALYEIRAERMAYSKQIREAEHVLSTLKEHEMEVARDLAADLRKLGGGTKLAGSVATFSPGSTDVFTVMDWDAFYEYIRKEDAFDLLERRPARGPLKERLDADKLPPGITHDTKFAYSLTKISAKR